MFNGLLGIYSLGVKNSNMLIPHPEPHTAMQVWWFFTMVLAFICGPFIWVWSKIKGLFHKRKH